MMMYGDRVVICDEFSSLLVHIPYVLQSTSPVS